MDLSKALFADGLDDCLSGLLLPVRSALSTKAWRSTMFCKRDHWLSGEPGLKHPYLR